MPELVTTKLPNGNEITYQIVGGTAYHAETPERIVSMLETARISEQRVRVFYGDAETGKDWMEEHDTIGRIGRSTGKVKIPLLIKSSASTGGGSILDNCIVKLMVQGIDGKYHTIYQHPSYKVPNLMALSHPVSNVPEHPYAVMDLDDKTVPARFKTLEKAQRWVKFMKGESARK